MALSQDETAKSAPAVVSKTNSLLDEIRGVKKALSPQNSQQFDRVKGAKWFARAGGSDILLIGAGGIGSWLGVLLSRIGARLHVYDGDIYETHNMTGQLIGPGAVGQNKARALVQVISQFNQNGATHYDYRQMYTQEEGLQNRIVFTGLDNMMARKTAYFKWKEMIMEVTKEKTSDAYIDEFFFCDGRLLAEQLQIFTISGYDKAAMELYEKEHLFTDAEVEEADCTFKQTSHVAAMIAGHMVGFFTNHLSNWVSKHQLSEGKGGLPVPFKFEYVVPFNLTTSDYVKS